MFSDILDATPCRDEKASNDGRAVRDRENAGKFSSGPVRDAPSTVLRSMACSPNSTTIQYLIGKLCRHKQVDADELATRHDTLF